MHSAPLPDPFPPFRALHGHLVALLESLSPEDWHRPVPNSEWSVKDTAAHLLDGDLRRLSFQRDGMTPPPPESPIEGPEDLTAFLNDLNADWIRAARRLSPRVITELTRWAGGEVVELFESLDPAGEALFPVVWAGEERSTHRFDVARELTEKWVHQQQIRDTVHRSLETPDRPEILHAVLATFLHALPHAYREVAAPDGTAVALRIEGAGGGSWTLRRDDGRWDLCKGPLGGGSEEPATILTLDGDTAWRVLSTRRKKPSLLPGIRITGDRHLAAAFASTVAVMA